jgi:DNA-binding transcriptional LysR family regulator
MDIPAIEAFLAVTRLNSFSLAAEQLFITQPAISKRIATLEDQLGVKLFDRIQRKVMLTEAGKIFLPGAQRISDEVRQSKNAIATMSGTIAGELCIATSHHIGLHRLPPILKQYINQYPQVDLNLKFMDSESALQAVENAQIELAIITLPTKTASCIRAYHVWDDPLAVVVGSSPPLLFKQKVFEQQNFKQQVFEQERLEQKLSEYALSEQEIANKKPGRITSQSRFETDKPFLVKLDQLCQYAAILPEKGTFTREIVDQYFTDVHINYQVKLSSNYLETIKMMVSVGLGWSVLPETILDNSLRTLTIEQFNVCRSLGIVHHASRTLSQSARKMFELIMNN